MPNGAQSVKFSFLGYNDQVQAYNLPIQNEQPIAILLAQNENELGGIIVEGTRSNRSIESIPTRVEVLTEEIDEASSMDPSKVAHLLTHSTGIQVQQTSATSNTANVRIQGLDGRYAQILRDGFPIYGGFSGSLSIMQIPPLDLRQVEYIKGSASTLYGAGAISGLINLISKEPQSNEAIVHINAAQVGAFDVNAFVSRKLEKTGFTFLAQRNTHRYFDADKDGFTDLPELTKYNFNPKLYFYLNDKTKLNIGATLTTETKRGGDTKVLNDEQADTAHFYQEKNDINRFTTQIKFDHALSENAKLEVRNSLNFFDRKLNITPSFLSGNYRFAGAQVSSFSEIAYSKRKNKDIFITGLNFYTDDFKENTLSTDTIKPRTENYQTVGVFANYVFDLTHKIAIESGLRTDYVLNGRIYVLPRASALFKWTNKLTSRIGGGMGYRNASMFNQEAEILGYKNVLPINRAATEAEQSYGGNIDIGYKTPLGERCFLNINQMFFYTYLTKPLVLQQKNRSFEFRNADGFTRSAGAETFFKLGFYDFVLFVGYTYTNATNTFGGNETLLTLTPQHSIKGDLLYALPNKWRIGFDYEFKSAQILSNGQATPNFWTMGALVEYTYKQYSVYGNVENFSDFRQTKFGSLRSAPYNTPQFTEVWAPLDGFVFNAGIKVNLHKE